MAEYIDKQKARDLFQQKCYNVSDRINSVELGMFVEGIMQVLDEATAADVQPVKRGHWIETDYGMFYECSECGNVQEFERNFCYECGADMRGDTE